MIDVVDYENPDNSVNVSKQDIENEPNGRTKMKKKKFRYFDSYIPKILNVFPTFSNELYRFFRKV